MKGNADTGVPIRVLLADDHAMFRQDLADVLAKYGAMEIVAEAPNDEDALRLARDLRPDSSDAEEAAFSKLHLKVQNHERKGSRGLLPIVVGTLILVKGEATRAEGFVAVVARTEGNGARPRSHLARLRQALRSGTHLPLPQARAWDVRRLGSGTPRAGG
jgi:hypothetical protein